jgi:hypothetical protein
MPAHSMKVTLSGQGERLLIERKVVLSVNVNASLLANQLFAAGIHAEALSFYRSGFGIPVNNLFLKVALVRC